MRIDDVKTFVSIVAAKTLGRCAEEMHLTQSSISKRLQRLESDIGVKLIERSKGARTVTLTRAGAAFMGIAHRWLEVQNEVLHLHDVSEQLPLSIGSLASQNNAFFIRMFRKLAQRSPVLRLNFMQRHSDEMYSLVEKREVSVGFSLLDLYNPSVRVRLCYEEPMVGLRHAAVPSKTEKTVRTGALDPEDELYMGWSNNIRMWHEQQWDPMARGRVRVDNVNVLREMLYDSRHWAILPYSFARVCAAGGSLEIFRLDPRPPDRVCYALTHKYPSEETRAALAIFSEMLAEFLHDELKEHGKVYPDPICANE